MQSDNNDSDFEETEQTMPQQPTFQATGHSQTAPMLQAAVSSTPLQMLHARTPFSQSQTQSQRVPVSIGTPFSATHWSGTPLTGTLPRGDLGRSATYHIQQAHLPPAHSQGHRAGLLPPSPGTPMSQAGFYSPAQPRHQQQHQQMGARRGALVGAGPGVAIADDAADMYMDVAGEGTDLTATDHNTFQLDDADQVALQQHMAETRIWGTDLNIQTCLNVFQVFIEYFGVQGTEASFYKKQLAIMHRTGDMRLNLNCSHLKSFAGTRQFYQQLRRYPQEVIPLMDRVVNEIYVAEYGFTDGMRTIQVRTFGMDEQSRMRGLDPKDIDQLLCIKGMVTRCSAIIPNLNQAFFRCFVCAHSLDVVVDRGRIEEPRSCPQCQTLASMEVIHNRGMYSDKQLIRLQETPDEIPAGETPHTVTLFAFEDLCDTVRPGDRIEVTGIFRAVPHRANPRLRSVKSIFKTYIDAIHFRRADQGEDRLADEEGGVSSVDRTVEATRTNTTDGADNLHTDTGAGTGADATVKQFSPARLREFYAFAAQGNAYDRLVKSFAPSIWEMDDVKRGLLCLLFGGTIRKGSKKQRASQRKRLLQNQGSSRESKQARREDDTEPQFNLGDDDQMSDGDEGDEGEDVREDQQGGVHQRGDINVLLCGDPGTSKSQLLSYVHKLTPRGIYTSGKGSSAVGLTASVLRDPETKDMVLESGALVLSDNGICCIDEFDKMTDQTRAILHEAMEQQTVSITKAGIIATLNARTSILASANPVQSRYNAKLSVVENIKLPPTLLSRFDLIYLILDKPNEDSDRKLAKHLVALYYDDEEAADAQNEHSSASTLQPVDQKFLRDYIAYARNNICPEISTEAEAVLVRNYVEMRSLGNGNGKTITATPRQLESLIRLAQALAKMRLSETVTAGDVLEATRLMKVATQTAATDPRTGTIDMDMITTGQTALGRELVTQLAEEVRRCLREEYAQGKTSSSVNSIFQTLRHNMGNQQGGMGELDLTPEKVMAAVEQLADEKVVFLSRSRIVTILDAINHTN